MATTNYIRRAASLVNTTSIVPKESGKPPLSGEISSLYDIRNSRELPMMSYWISLPVGWKLQDIQAGLSIAIAFLCAGGIFVLVRFFWVRAARDVIRTKRAVPTHTLLSLNTIGEVADVIFLLRGDLFTRKYIQIAVQSTCILLLTVASLMSALLARYSTRAHVMPVPRETSGILAERSLQSGSAGITANQTLNALKQANFPSNQLLDFLPDPEIEWQYQPDQWTNSSWSMNCTYTALNEIPHANIQDCSEGIFDEIPYLNHLFSDWPDTGWNWGWSGSGFEYNLTEWKDYTVFLHATWGVDMYSNEIFSPGDCGCPMREMNVRALWIHLQDVGRSNDSSCTFRRSHARLFQYTSMSCKLVKNSGPIPKDQLFLTSGAAPDIYDDQTSAQAYNMQYGPRLIRESMQDLPITVVAGEELTQFYQAALIAKDTQLSRQRRVSRIITVYTPITQISLICLVLCGVGAFVVLFGLLYYYFFIFRHWDNLDGVPQSKLDWMVKNMRLENEQKERERDRDLKQAYATTVGSEGGTDFSATSTLVAYRRGDVASLAENGHVNTGRHTSLTTRTPENSSLIEFDPASMRDWRQ